MNSASGASLTAKEIFRLVEVDLQKVELQLRSKSRSANPVINDVNDYIHDSGGKRLRPALLLLSSKLCGCDGDEAAIELGVVVEQIHAATLLHDDIIDDAQLRRGRPSVNSRWGNQVSVLAGDWLYMTSFHLALQLRNHQILDVLIDVTRKMVEGELMQLKLNGRADISADEQLAVCLHKTACLFSACGRLGGLLGRVSSEREERLGVYGRALGMAFQLVDDLLDYTSNEHVLGKPVLKDLEEGKVTLPIIYLMQRAEKRERKFIGDIIRQQDFSTENKREIIRLVQTYETLTETQNLANHYAAQARDCLLDFPDSIFRDALLKVPELVVSREK